MSRIIVVTSGKGGVGKTTTSASFAAGLALRGHKTAVIDFDVGAFGGQPLRTNRRRGSWESERIERRVGCEPKADEGERRVQSCRAVAPEQQTMHADGSQESP
jgi:MinD superfamily P-loop ATPase